MLVRGPVQTKIAHHILKDLAPQSSELLSVTTALRRVMVVVHFRLVVLILLIQITCSLSVHGLIDAGPHVAALTVNGPTVLAVDNEAAIKIATNLGVTARNKHFADALHYFRHLVDHLVVKPTFVRTTMQRADGFTKPLGKTLFRPWVASLGLK